MACLLLLLLLSSFIIIIIIIIIAIIIIIIHFILFYFIFVDLSKECDVIPRVHWKHAAMEDPYPVQVISSTG